MGSDSIGRAYDHLCEKTCFVRIDTKMADSYVKVVQHNIGGICPDYSMHKAGGSAAISSSILATALEHV